MADSPKRLSGLTLATGAATGVYAALAVSVPQPVLVEILNGLFVGLVCAVTIVFFPLFWRAVREKNFDRVTQLTFGIILTWASLITSRTLSVASRAGGDDGYTSMADSGWVPFAAYLAILGGILHITAPGMVENKLRYNKGLLAMAVAVGALIAVVTVMIQQGTIPVGPILQRVFL